jgi:RNA polymerase sigma-70 factor (ECF subfamily)
MDAATLPAGKSRFYTTQWTRVCTAREDSEEGRMALADLCDAYYEPVLTFLRHELGREDAARETAHEFFAATLRGGTMRSADQERGRFRSYLLGAVKHFLSHQREAARRMKRGSGVEPVSLNTDDSKVFAVADVSAISADMAYDRQWALAVLARALEALRCTCRMEGKEALFDRLKPWLTGSADRGAQSALAADFGMTSAAMKMAVQRLKQRFRRCLKEEIAGTLEDPAMVDEEMQSLFAALAD